MCMEPRGRVSFMESRIGLSVGSSMRILVSVRCADYYWSPDGFGKECEARVAGRF